MTRTDAAPRPQPVQDPTRSTLRTVLAKVLAFILLCLLVGALSAAVTSMVAVGAAGYGLVIAVLFTVGIYALTRLYRSRGESDAPRPWWRMTGRPAAAFLLALFFLANAVEQVVVGQGALGRLQNLPYLVLGGLYLATGIVLVRTGMHRTVQDGR